MRDNKEVFARQTLIKSVDDYSKHLNNKPLPSRLLLLIFVSLLYITQDIYKEHLTCFSYMGKNETTTRMSHISCRYTSTLHHLLLNIWNVNVTTFDLYLSFFSFNKMKKKKSQGLNKSFSYAFFFCYFSSFIQSHSLTITMDHYNS